MAILTYDQYFGHVLAQLSDGNVRTVSEICEAVAARTGLTEEERAVAVGTGEAKYRNRVRWSLVHLYKAGMVAREGRGRYKITDRGAEALASGERVDRGYLLRFPEYREYVETERRQESDSPSVRGSDAPPARDSPSTLRISLPILSMSPTTRAFPMAK